MPRIKIDPQCRYGHGPLNKLPNSFMIEGVKAQRNEGGTLPLESRLTTRATGATLTINAFWCPECGYTELQEWQEWPETEPKDA